ncbi:MAG: shikimate dehydrogenase [Clostridioides sp.]|jgi:shikimate dehydrogenase|nr:shikimate dehydrogenase [Clostridioides sp.]
MIYGLIGEKLGHSFSKEIHEKIADYTYKLIPVSKDLFDDFMKEKNFTAINVTIPYKEKVIPYLGYIDDKAKKIGAVNTIVKKEGKLFGYNTDYYGFKYMLEKNKIDPKDKKILILGKGGASKACIEVVKDMGSKEIQIVYYRVISENIKTISKEGPQIISYENCYKNHSDAQIIINTTPVGMYPNTEDSPVDLSKFNNLEAVVDVIYNPLRTKFLIDGIDKGVICVGGLEMLIAQAKFAVEIFLNKKIRNDIIQEIHDSLMKERRNIVLIGMSGCGKSTIGKLLAQILKKEFVDVDEEIVKEINMSIEEFFSKKDEIEFRKIERNIIQNLSKMNGLIISTGGGVVKNKENIIDLKKNGKIIWIKRDVSLLESGNGRPLAPDFEATKNLYKERLPLYEKSSEIIVENNESIENTLEKLIKYIE